MLYLKRKRKFRKDRIESTMHMKRIDFENGTITGNILGAALPMLVAQILNLLYNIVDRIYIARIPWIRGIYRRRLCPGRSPRENSGGLGHYNLRKAGAGEGNFWKDRGYRLKAWNRDEHQARKRL